MKPFFTAEDFDCHMFSVREHYAKIANEKLAKWIEKNGKKVYGTVEDGDGGFYFTDYTDEFDTYQAILIDIQEIKPKCNHERSIKNLIDNGRECESVCVRCGVKLKAKWEVADE